MNIQYKQIYVGENSMILRAPSGPTYNTNTEVWRGHFDYIRNDLDSDFRFSFLNLLKAIECVCRFVYYLIQIKW